MRKWSSSTRGYEWANAVLMSAYRCYCCKCQCSYSKIVIKKQRMIRYYVQCNVLTLNSVIESDWFEITSRISTACSDDRCSHTLHSPSYIGDHRNYLKIRCCSHNMQQSSFFHIFTFVSPYYVTHESSPRFWPFHPPLSSTIATTHNKLRREEEELGEHWTESCNEIGKGGDGDDRRIWRRHDNEGEGRRNSAAHNHQWRRLLIRHRRYHWSRYRHRHSFCSCFVFVWLLVLLVVVSWIRNDRNREIDWFM